MKMKSFLKSKIIKMNPEELIPLAKRLEELNDAIDKYQKMGEYINENPSVNIRIGIEDTRDDEVSQRQDFAVGGMPLGLLSMMQQRQPDKFVYKFDFNDTFALEFVGSVIQILHKERESVIEEMKKHA